MLSFQLSISHSTKGKMRQNEATAVAERSPKEPMGPKFPWKEVNVPKAPRPKTTWCCEPEKVGRKPELGHVKCPPVTAMPIHTTTRPTLNFCPSPQLLSQLNGSLYAYKVAPRPNLRPRFFFLHSQPLVIFAITNCAILSRHSSLSDHNSIATHQSYPTAQLIILAPSW